MPAKPSGEVKTSIVRSQQKNGDIYLLSMPNENVTLNVQ